MKYYNGSSIRKTGADYLMVIGLRSNGKTFDALTEAALQDYIDEHRTAAYVRRLDEAITAQRCKRLASALTHDGKGKNQVAIRSKGKYNDIRYWSKALYLQHVDDDGNVDLKDTVPFIQFYSLNTWENDKGGRDPFLKNIIFDEFLTRGRYLTDEFVIWQNVVATLKGNKDDIKIYMLANTVNKYCPYFGEMGLKRIKTQKPGTIDLYTMGESGLTIAVEYCNDAENYTASKANRDRYFAFDNPQLKMITDSAWEIAAYPRLPYKYEKSDVCGRFYIAFADELVEGEIIYKNDDVFAFIHPKTTPLPDNVTDVIYTLEPSMRPNRYQSVYKAYNPFCQRIGRLFLTGKVCYSSNDVGEYVNNYLKECKKVGA